MSINYVILLWLSAKYILKVFLICIIILHFPKNVYMRYFHSKAIRMICPKTVESEIKNKGHDTEQ